MRCFLQFVFLSVHAVALAQSENDKPIMTVEEMSKMRQDPVSGLRSVFFQQILLPVGEGTASSTSIQPVWPFRLGKNLKLITYTIIPIQTLPPFAGEGTRASGMGNILLNGYFSSVEKKGNFSWGLGPAIQLPTRSDPALGSDRVSVGPSALLHYSLDKFSIGGVIQNLWSFGGDGVNVGGVTQNVWSQDDDGADKVNSLSFQYFAYYNLPKGWTLVSNATIISNWLASEADRWLIPLGGGSGKTFQIGKSRLFYSATAQMFYNVSRPSVVGEWEAVFQFQIIF